MHIMMATKWTFPQMGLDVMRGQKKALEQKRKTALWSSVERKRREDVTSDDCTEAEKGTSRRTQQRIEQ